MKKLWTYKSIQNLGSCIRNLSFVNQRLDNIIIAKHLNKSFHSSIKASDKGFYSLQGRYFFKKNRILLKKDYYSKSINLEILGVSRTSSQADIKKAFFTLAKEWHPDRNKAANAKEKFAEISE